ncbi:MAG TPA: hypothetical protein VMT27_01435, partial [Actinomycetes bacterium]|nr:hypothetical protein [Actinomycetes bacterium]
EVHAVEMDPGARPWLEQNARLAPINVHQADIDGCLPDLDAKVDLVVANPPYIPTDAVPRDVEVARFDPELALYGGTDGLDHIRTVERVAARLVRPGGWVVVEHADQQGESAPEVFATAAGWSQVSDHRDLAGRARFLTARRDVDPGVDPRVDPGVDTGVVAKQAH